MRTPRHKSVLLEGKRFLLVNLVIFLIVMIAFVRVSIRNHQLKNETIAQMEQRVKDLDGRVIEFAGLNRELGSEFFLEEEARLRFGLVKPGERVVVVNDADSMARNIGGENPFDEETAPLYRGNPTRWYLYFFHTKEFDQLKIREGATNPR